MVIFQNNGFKILRKDTDEDIVKILKDGICPELPLMRKKNIGGFGEMNGIGFNVYSAQISKDLCKHLQINPGKKIIYSKVSKYRIRRINMGIYKRNVRWRWYC